MLTSTGIYTIDTMYIPPLEEVVDWTPVSVVGTSTVVAVMSLVVDKSMSMQLSPVHVG